MARFLSLIFCLLACFPACMQPTGHASKDDASSPEEEQACQSGTVHSSANQAHAEDLDDPMGAVEGMSEQMAEAFKRASEDPEVASALDQVRRAMQQTKGDSQGRQPRQEDLQGTAT